MNLDQNKHWVSVVLSKNLININVSSLYGRSTGVPTYNAFLAMNLPHHVEHSLMIDVIKKPNLRLLEVLIERHGIAVGHIEEAVVTVLTQ